MASQSGHNDVTGIISSPVELGDLPSKRLLGKGLASIGYETEVNGERFVRKDFIGAPSGLFEKEAAVLVGLEDHKNIVKTLGWTVDKTSCSLVVEYVDDNLQGLLRKRKAQSQGGADDDHLSPPFELPEAVDIMLQIASGMEHLHDHGILHGDLKTKNILVNNCNGDKSSLSVKVADFGLVGTKRKSMSFVSRQARKRDMVRWKAPEILELLLSKDRDETSSESDSDESTVGSLLVMNWRQLGADVYSFALICSQILTGEDPYPNDLNWKEWGVDIVACNLRPTLPTACPSGLRTLLNSCWDHNSPLYWDVISLKSRPTFSYIRRALEHLVPSRQMALPVRTHPYLGMDPIYTPADEVIVVTDLINAVIKETVSIKSSTGSYEDLESLTESLEGIQLDVAKIEVQLWVLRKMYRYIQRQVEHDCVEVVEVWLTRLQHALYLTVSELRNAYPGTIRHYLQLGSVGPCGLSLLSMKILEHIKEIDELAKSGTLLELQLNDLLSSYSGQVLHIHNQVPFSVFLETLFELLSEWDQEILKDQFRLVLMHPFGLWSIEKLEMFKLHEPPSGLSTCGPWSLRPSHASSGRPYPVDSSSYASSGGPHRLHPSSYASSSRPHSVDLSSMKHQDSASRSNSSELHITKTAGMGVPHHVLDIEQAMMKEQPEPWPHMDMDAPIDLRDVVTPDIGDMMQYNSLWAIEKPIRKPIQKPMFLAFHGEPGLLLQGTSSRSSDGPPAFKQWRCEHLVSRRSEGSAHQFLLRRCFEFFRSHIPRMEAHVGSAVQHDGVPSGWLPRPRGRKRIGTPDHPDHHEVAEQRSKRMGHRRRNQQDYFAALRKLVPIISKKYEKSSILENAILHLEDLKVQIQDQEVSMAEMASQYEKLKMSYQELQEQNKQLQAKVSATGPVLNPEASQRPETG